MPSCVVPHYRPCLLVCCRTIGNAFWCLSICAIGILKMDQVSCGCCASLSTMPVGVLSHYRICLLVWCLIISHAFWCGASLYVMPSGERNTLSAIPVDVVSHYRPCLLAWYLRACWSIATATDILPVECIWKKDGYKSGATCTEVPLYQTWLLIRCHSQICLFVQCNSIRHARWVHLFRSQELEVRSFDPYSLKPKAHNVIT